MGKKPIPPPPLSCPLPRHVRKERKPRMIFWRRSTYAMSLRDTYSNEILASSMSLPLLDNQPWSGMGLLTSVRNQPTHVAFKSWDGSHSDKFVVCWTWKSQDFVSCWVIVVGFFLGYRFFNPQGLACGFEAHGTILWYKNASQGCLW